MTDRIKTDGRVFRLVPYGIDNYHANLPFDRGDDNVERVFMIHGILVSLWMQIKWRTNCWQTSGVKTSYLTENILHAS